MALPVVSFLKKHSSAAGVSDLQYEVQFHGAKQESYWWQERTHKCVKAPKLLFTIIVLQKPKPAIHGRQVPLAKGEGNNYQKADEFDHIAPYRAQPA